MESNRADARIRKHCGCFSCPRMSAACPGVRSCPHLWPREPRVEAEEGVMLGAEHVEHTSQAWGIGVCWMSTPTVTPRQGRKPHMSCPPSRGIGPRLHMLGRLSFIVHGIYRN